MFYHQALARAFQDVGTDVIFGLIGDGNLFAMDSFQREFGGRYVSFGNEGGAVLAAAGYASRSGRLGVATVTHGPGLTNTVSALVEVTRSRLPVLVFAGDTDPADPEHMQDIDQRAIVAPTGAGWEQARSPKTVARDVERAARRALAEQRPIVLNIPANFQWQEVPEHRRATEIKAATSPLGEPTLDALEVALGIIASSRRPIVLGGRGAAGARVELEELAALIGAPVATTLRGKGLFKNNPHDLRIFGTLSHDIALDAITKADCVIAFGAALKPVTTDKGSLLEGCRVVHVDNDPASMAVRPDVDVDVLGDAGSVARALTAHLKEADVESTGFASPDLASALADYYSRPMISRPEAGIDMELAVRTIEEAFPAERNLTIDCGRFCITSFREFTAPDPYSYIHTSSFASIGYSVASAVGAQVAAPDLPGLVIGGDGGFMNVGINEVSAVVRNGVNLVIILLNDSAYGAEHIQFTRRGMDPSMSMFQWPNFAAVAEACGAIGVTVKNHDDLDEALKIIENRDRAVLIDMHIDPDAVPMPGY